MDDPHPIVPFAQWARDNFGVIGPAIAAICGGAVWLIGGRWTISSRLTNVEQVAAKSLDRSERNHESLDNVLQVLARLEGRLEGVHDSLERIDRDGCQFKGRLPRKGG